MTPTGEDSLSNERSSLLGSVNQPDDVLPQTPVGGAEHMVYKRRWYILLLFSTLACVQAGLCAVWTVVAESCEAAFGWTDSDLSLITMWLYITYLVSMGPFAWLMQRKGLRVSMVISAFLLFLGTVCRVITSSPPYVKWLAHAGHIFNGLAGPVLFSGSAVVSSLWFPPEQRATATSIGAVFGIGGIAFTFLLDPRIVPSPTRIMTPTGVNITNIPEMRESLMYLRYGEFGVVLVLLVLVLAYFPDKPHTAPSNSAESDTLSFKRGLRLIFSFQNINFWMAAIPSFISPGLAGVFAGLLDVNLKAINVSQVTAGWINFYSTIASCGFGMVLGKLGDKCIGNRKLILMICAVGAALSSFAAVLIINGYIPFTIVGLYISLILLGMLTNGTLPLYYEVCIEATYPIPESITMGVVTASYNVLPVFFLLVFFIPNVGTSWMNWFMYVALVLCPPILLFFKEKYERLSLDVLIPNSKFE